MGSPIFISQPPPGFSVLSIVRGVQLAFVGVFRSLQNPDLYNEKYYNEAFQALKMSLIVQLILYVPLIACRMFFGFLSLFLISAERANGIYGTISYIQHSVLNIGPFVIMSIRFLRPELDQMFMTSLEYADKVYKQRHPESTRQYYAPLINIPAKDNKGSNKFMAVFKAIIGDRVNKIKRSEEFEALFWTYILYASSSFALYLLSHIPIVGGLVLPIMSLLKFNGFVGTTTALVIFAVLLVAPPWYGAVFLSSYYGSRALMLDLLSPYLRRIPLNKLERNQWIRAREGVLYGFGLSFYFMLKIPFVGVLVYGLAEASVAYMITKITDPYPSSQERKSASIAEWVDTQLVWTKKFESLSLGGETSVVPGEFIYSPRPEVPKAASEHSAETI
ncbi:unnamed protein product [Kuraishia capsulata CBS 1993]|uniref:Transmembrane protein UsgS n=1 Tax=Kuraishia capsulata CBS 1993 TaxID=1382522 RepID=W6MF12_9ASCO|nr:uncharacterized protein KUCA_T00000044001 [Kuraishia capsulata CBS 1993]CDK24084.1 unnamed protein product [Kuraishia capsulata CBS 1993]